MNVKKRLTLTAVFLCIIMLLCSCGGKNAGNENGSTGNDSNTANVTDEKKNDSTADSNGNGTSEQAAASDKYKVICRESDGTPVEGVLVQFCISDSCMLEKTDAEGSAYFNLKPGEFEVTVYSVPDGFVIPEEPEKTDSGFTEYIIERDAQAAGNNGGIGEEPSDNGKTSSASGTSEFKDLNFITDSGIDISQYNLIMVNYWEPWCYYCVEEMPDLEFLYETYENTGFLIVGLYSTEEDAAETIASTGITYPTIKYDDSEYTMNGVPATIFINGRGEMLEIPAEEIIDYYYGIIEDDVRCYFDGDYDEYKDDEYYADYFADLEATENDPAKIRELAAEYAQDEIDSSDNVFVGSADFSTWEDRILNRLSGPDD